MVGAVLEVAIFGVELRSDHLPADTQRVASTIRDPDEQDTRACRLREVLYPAVGRLNVGSHQKQHRITTSSTRRNMLHFDLPNSPHRVRSRQTPLEPPDSLYAVQSAFELTMGSCSWPNCAPGTLRRALCLAEQSVIAAGVESGDCEENSSSRAHRPVHCCYCCDMCMGVLGTEH